MNLRNLITAFMTVNGIAPVTIGRKQIPPRYQDLFENHGVTDGNITDPIVYIAAVTDRTTDTIYVWLRQAEQGIGPGQDQLDPVNAMTLIWIADQALIDNEKPMVDNPVRDYLMPRLTKYYKSKFKSRRHKSNAKTRKG